MAYNLAKCKLNFNAYNGYNLVHDENDIIGAIQFIIMRMIRKRFPRRSVVDWYLLYMSITYYYIYNNNNNNNLFSVIFYQILPAKKTTN